MSLLDTNVVSELRNVKTGRAIPGVAQWAEQVDAGSLAAPASPIVHQEQRTTTFIVQAKPEERLTLLNE